MKAIVKHLILGFALRLLLIFYGLYQDSASDVNYTDIDYQVYSDAAAYMTKGISPYKRETYRYTPILAAMLTPNFSLFFSYGKLLFCLFDMLTAYLIYSMLEPESETNSNEGDKRWNWSLLWIYNPLPMVICSRGSSESVVLALVLSVLFFCQKEANGLTGLLYGFSVHFKPYTLPYCLPLYLALGPKSKKKEKNEDPATIELPQNWFNWLKDFFTITGDRVKLIIGSILGFGIPTLVCYWIYGDEFLQETYFYHLTRKDTRHNFSVYFYLLYLNYNNDGLFLKIVSFLPQLILLAAVALQFPRKTDLPFTLFVQTYVFVIFNKVCTSQYFLWYLSFLPILAPKLQMKWNHALILLCIWYFAQISWLIPAYYLEFEGRNTFTYIWLESIAFYCANIGILAQIIKSYRPNLIVNPT